MKRILKLLTSRLVQTGISIFLQILIVFLINLIANEIFVYYYIFCFVIGCIFSIYVINTNSNANYKIAWILLLLVVPMVGVGMYIILSGRLLSKRKARKMMSITQSIKDKLDTSNEIKFDDEIARGQSQYIKDFSYSGPVENTNARYFCCGQDFFESLMKDIENAKSRIYLEYFIIKPGFMWNSIKEKLITKATQGLDVRLIYDDFGCIDKLTLKELRSLTKYGIKARSFNVFIPVLDIIINNRDHRKLCIIDSQIAYTGGINIADEYINKKERFGYWKDCGIALYGEGAFTMEVFFLSMWEHVTKSKLKTIKGEYPTLSTGVYQPYTDSPIDNELVGENVYINMISSAKKYVYISTPYFVVDDEMLRAITNASKRGVEVKIILPGIPDKKIVNQVTKSYYKRLIEAGVKVYEYKRGFNHSKIVVVDGEIATIGSVNFDYRSFYLSFECGVWIYKAPVIDDILLDVNLMIKQSTQISLQDCKANIFTRLLRGILSTVAPLF
ncbi:MAG: cardiolipin synthase [Clostridia bacterium]|nr:cardiolipin synthase [Clostridia bacterium]